MVKKNGSAESCPACARKDAEIKQLRGAVEQVQRRAQSLIASAVAALEPPKDGKKAARGGDSPEARIGRALGILRPDEGEAPDDVEDGEAA